MVKREKRKIPRKALEDLVLMCEWESKKSGEPASDIFKRYLGLMNKYADYFFDKPWPKDYCFEEATTFTDEDLDFLSENNKEFKERFDTMCLKKNMHLGGFMGVFGMFWTWQAYFKQFVRPELEPIVEAFKTFAANDENPKKVLDKLKERFDSVYLIHLSLVDMLENEYLDKTRGLLVARILELIHTEEGLPPCGEFRCKLQIEMLHEN